MTFEPQEDPTFEVQTRNREGAILQHSDFATAFAHAKEDVEVWKISFSLPTDERIRLVKDFYPNGVAFWRWEPILSF